MHGRGKMTEAGGEVVEGIWQNGYQVKIGLTGQSSISQTAES